MAANLLLPPRQAVERLAAVLGLAERDASRVRLSACDRLLPLAPRGKRDRRNLEAWLVALARGDYVLLLTAPASEQSLRHLPLFPASFRRLVEEFGIIRSPALGLTGMIAPRAVESASNDLAESIREPGIMPFFQHGNGDWDVFMDPEGGIGCFFHEEQKIEPVADGLGQWFELRYAECLV